MWIIKEKSHQYSPEKYLRMGEKKKTFNTLVVFKTFLVLAQNNMITFLENKLEKSCLEKFQNQLQYVAIEAHYITKKTSQNLLYFKKNIYKI